MSKIKWFKYVLASAALLVVCACFAFAASDDVVATVNGQPYSSLASALNAAQPGQRVVLVSDSSESGTLNVNAGVDLVIPAGVELVSDARVVVSGSLTSYGNIIRNNNASQVNLIDVANSGSVTVYGDLLSSSLRGNVIGVAGSSTNPNAVTIYGGRLVGLNNSIVNNSTSGGVVTVYGGNFDPDLTLSSGIVLAPGVSLVDEGTYSWGPLYFIGHFVTSACQWIALLCAVIVTNKLLLIFLLVVFSALGVGLIKRVVR